jgi:nicotinate dehydrogenase subunit B
MISKTETSIDSESRATLTRREFVKVGGALFVSLYVPIRGLSLDAAEFQTSVDPTLFASWLEIRNDNTIIMRTGRSETGVGMSAYYAQTAAEELNVRPEAISLVMGDTDKTPDGGSSSGFLRGAANVRKVAAYTYQALLGLASTKLGIPVSALTVTDGIVMGSGKNISYGQLVQGRHLDLKIPISGEPASVDPSASADSSGIAGRSGFTVMGDPPVKPMTQYKVVGTSYAVPGIPDKITGKTQWSCDVKLPGMLHARMVRPATLGSTLVAVGALDKKKFPTAEAVRKGNLVAVVSPNEWEVVAAASSVASTTKWTAWSGLAGSNNLTKTFRDHNWGAPTGSRGNAANVTGALAGAHKAITATYEQGFVRHAPIGPFVAVADVPSDGIVTVWTHSAQSQGLRAQIANTLSMPVQRVVVRWLEHSGQYGRTTKGGDGAEGDAAILSQLTGKPVRVQWTLQEDLAWSSVSPGWISDVKGGLDSNGHLVAVHSSWYSTHQNDARLLGAILAGLPSVTPKPDAGISTTWPYDKVQNRFEEAYAMPNIGEDAGLGGLRGTIMRTPAQRQQNFALEAFINEAAAAAAVDPIQFRIDHTTDPRLIEILNATANAAGWEPRHSPHPAARRNGTSPVTGRGVAVMIRSNGYWVGIAEVAVTPDTGLVQVTKFTIGLDCGKVINPRQLDRCMKSGLVMGLGEALKEEVTFDNQKVTSTNWNTYKIMTMEETPEIKVVQISRDDKGFGQGSEGANAVGPPAVAAAVFDATGAQPRRIPLSPEYVRALLKV